MGTNRLLAFGQHNGYPASILSQQRLLARTLLFVLVRGDRSVGGLGLLGSRFSIFVRANYKETGQAETICVFGGDLEDGKSGPK